MLVQRNVKSMLITWIIARLVLTSAANVRKSAVASQASTRKSSIKCCIKTLWGVFIIPHRVICKLNMATSPEMTATKEIGPLRETEFRINRLFLP